MQIISSTRFSSTRQHLDEVIPMSQMACHFSCGPPRRTRSKTNFISLFILVFAALIVSNLRDIVSCFSALEEPRMTHVPKTDKRDTASSSGDFLEFQAPILETKNFLSSFACRVKTTLAPKQFFYLQLREPASCQDGCASIPGTV
ncbi:putative transmembrane protein [Toxoplasma gondii MAS]|uniref:Putative transmembrane protein n=1 Tax=Toxoplasma gondii MAS TaxID=943118 RepID=A0A086PVZ0_TOXGO|nr:putative transmembrane protein [Toxoplasma gondii MAS]